MSTYNKLVGATSDGLLPPAVLDRIGPAITDTGTRPVGKGEIVLNARDMGALGDGATDDTAALQDALDASAGRDVFIPHGRYWITSTLIIPSGGVVRGENGTVIVNGADLPTLIEVSGSTGTEQAIAAPVGTNDRTITTTAPHGFQAGDVVQFKSQRISTSDDAGDWRLGFSTGTAPGPFFGEFGTVQNVTGGTTFTLDAGLVFPGYRPDATQETDPDAGSHATVRKVDGARNILISTLEIEGTSGMAVRAKLAVDLRIENLRYVKHDTGRFIGFHECYRSMARNCWVSNELEVTPGLDHAHVNSFHIVSSQSTGFDGCTVISGTQGFDITYSNSGRIPSLFCYVTNSSSFAALNNHMTVHPGTYAATIISNNFSEAQRAGVSIRANRTLFANNILRGSGETYGLYISEGGGKDSLITGNTISNFETGLAVIDGDEKPYAGRIGVTFSNNHVTGCQWGYRRYRNWDLPVPPAPDGITLLGNTFESALPDAVGVETSRLGRPTWGLTVQANAYRLTGTGSVAVTVTNNSRGVAVVGNTIWEAVTALARDDSGDVHRWPDPCVTEWTGNVTHGDVSNMPPATADWRFKSRDPDPHAVAYPDLNLYTETARIMPASTSQVTVEAGFPVAAANVIVETVRRSSGSAFQYTHSDRGDMHMRRMTASGSFVSWSKRH